MFTYIAKCVRVVDGDTLDLDIDLGFGVHKIDRFRIAGINTPETYGVKKESAEYAAGMKAKNRLEELVMDKELIVTTEKDKKGKYGRYIATILVELTGENVGETLVSEGLAEHKKY